MARLFYAGVAVLLVLLIFPCAARGSAPSKEEAPLKKEEAPSFEGTTAVKITADEISYDYNQKQLTASGAVRIEYQEIKIEALKVIIDQELEMILATGQVHVSRKDDEFTGDRFLYCLQTGQGWVSPMSSTVNDGQLKGPVKFLTEEAKLKGEEIDAKNVFLASCDLKRPHYHLTAGRIEYYPGKRIIFHNVWYWEGGIRLLYLPYLVISLEKENFEVDFGYNQVDGWWLWVGYPYEGDNYYGKITTRLTENSPDEYGIVNNNRIGGQKYWYQKLALKNDGPLTYPSLLGLGYRDETSPQPDWLIDNVDLAAQQAINPEGSFFWKKTFHLGAPGQSPYPSLTVDYADDPDLLWSFLRTTSGWQYNPDTTLNSNLYFNWLLEQPDKNAPDQIFRNQMDSLWTLRKDWSWSNLFLKYDIMRVASGEFYHDNLLPELTYTIPKWKAPGLGEIGVTAQYTSLERYSATEVESGDRKALDLTKSVNFFQKDRYSINWNNKAQFRSYFTANGAADFSNFTTGLKFTDRITPQLKTDIDLDYIKVNGDVPALFGGYDRDKPGFTIRNSWNWDSQTLHISLSDDYNFDSQYLAPAALSLNWAPGDQERINFNTKYDWELQSFGATNLRVDFKPRDNWILLLELGYDFSKSVWSQRKLQANITQQLAEKWRMLVKASYDILTDSANNGGFSEAMVGLIYDWHCRELHFHYDYVKQEYWVNLVFKVLPEYQFRILTSGDLLEYYFNEF
ncbi:MAG: hypothetical protein K6U80_00085 [Firmicutes bacterium]|nr:hypothetical protein [Bacillota bacterium]